MTIRTGASGEAVCHTRCAESESAAVPISRWMMRMMRIPIGRGGQDHVELAIANDGKASGTESSESIRMVRWAEYFD